MGSWQRGKCPQHIPVRTAWPLLYPIDNASGDFAILKSPLFETFCQQRQSSLSLHEFNTLEQTFFSLYQQYIQGLKYDHSQWSEWTTQYSLSSSLEHDISPPLSAPFLIPLTFLSDLSEDYLPEIGMLYHSLIWGTVSEDLLHKTMKILAGAICSTLPLLQYHHSPASKAFDQRPKLPDQIHQSLSTHCRTPAMLWSVEKDFVRPLLPLARQYSPIGPIHNLPSTQYMIAKVIQVQHNWTAHFVFPFESLGSLVEELSLRLQIEWLRGQRHCSTLVFEDILRDRADILYRSAAEHLLETSKEELTWCLDYYS